MTPKQIGILGEKITCNYLRKKGYRILDKNYSPHHISGPKRGEIDVVARKDGVISFLEVKTLRDPASLIAPEAKVNYQKKKKITKTAESWLVKQKISLDSKWQIDVISIIIDLNSKKAKIRHFKNV